jgi:hypothetical protein
MSRSPTGSSTAPEGSEVEHDVADAQLAGISKRHSRVIQLTVAAVFAALSAAVSPIASMLPRIPGWGIALFDPVSFFWIIAFLIAGIRVGMLSTTLGAFCLFFFDPTGIGPVFKFLATAPMIFVPWLGVRRYGRGMGGQFLARGGNYAILMVAAFFVRLLLMIPLNLVIVPLLFSPYATWDYIITYTLVVNAIQSLWDALVPFLVIYPTSVFEHFKMW